MEQIALDEEPSGIATSRISNIEARSLDRIQLVLSSMFGGDQISLCPVRALITGGHLRLTRDKAKPGADPQ